MSLDMNSLIFILVVGLIAGWLASMVMKGKGFGLIGDLVLGIAGAFIGSYLFGLLGISAGGLVGSIIVAFVGAVILLFIVRLIKKA